MENWARRSTGGTAQQLGADALVKPLVAFRAAEHHQRPTEGFIYILLIPFKTSNFFLILLPRTNDFY